MTDVNDNSVHLMVTSPPYPMIEMWDNQFRQLDSKIDGLWKKMEKNVDSTLREEYVSQIYDLMHENLAKVWKETYRVLINGGIACINIGDATRSFNGNFRLFANHSKIIEVCEKVGFTSVPFILWKKPTTKPKYKGKGAFLGSGMLPPNAYVTQDCEFILIFRKDGLRKFEPHDTLRYESMYKKDERDSWFTQIWDVVGIKQAIADVERRTGAFPDEIPRRLIRMFSVKGDTILDPFLGTGTSTKVAIELERNSVGYEVDEGLKKTIEEKIGYKQGRLSDNITIEIRDRPNLREPR